MSCFCDTDSTSSQYKRSPGVSLTRTLADQSPKPSNNLLLPHNARRLQSWPGTAHDNLGGGEFIDPELFDLNRKMELIKLQCQELLDEGCSISSSPWMHSTPPLHRCVRNTTSGFSPLPAAISSRSETTGAAPQSPRIVPRMGTWQNVERGGSGFCGGGITWRESPPSGITARPSDSNESSPPIWRLQYHQPRRLFTRDQSADTHAGIASTNIYAADVINSVTTDNSTSAYSTLHSSPLIDTLGTAAARMSAADYQLIGPEQPQLPMTTRKSHSDPERQPRTAAQMIATSPSPRDCSSDGDLNNVENGRCSTDPGDEKSLQNLYARYVQVMYTNEANLAHTIGVQQKLFEQQLDERQQQLLRQLSERPPRPAAAAADKLSDSREVCVDDYENFRGSSSNYNDKDNGYSGERVSGGSRVIDDGSGGSPGETKYVVKRRADGTRYITRRPIKQPLVVRSRARSTLRQCSAGDTTTDPADVANVPLRYAATTDDEAVSEVKLGRYWNKEDRKKHAEKSREYRRNREAIRLLQKNEQLAAADAAKNAKLSIVTNVSAAPQQRGFKNSRDVTEVGKQKALRHHGGGEKKVLDRFTTLQELMVHGSRGRTYNPLLSVTTV